MLDFNTRQSNWNVVFVNVKGIWCLSIEGKMDHLLYFILENVPHVYYMCNICVVYFDDILI